MGPIRTWLGIALRGIWGRRGVTATIFVVAVVATAAATVGPLYLEAAGTSILQDTLHNAPPTGQGIDVAASTPPSTAGLQSLEANVQGVLATSPAASDFGPPITAIEFTGHLNPGIYTTLAWRSGECTQLRFTQGRCASGIREVDVSQTLARAMNLHVGSWINDALTNANNGNVPLQVVGLYAPLDQSAQYWFSRPYFATPPSPKNGPEYTDALFTAPTTFKLAAQFDTGQTVVDLPLKLDGTSFADIPALTALVGALTTQVSTAETVSTMPAQLAAARTSQQALTVPVILVTAQLLVLCWLLLFLLVTDAAEARGNEVALAKLRGLTRRQTVLFGLSEQVVLLLVALPVGALVGWVATKALAALILRAHTPVPLVGLGWAAAAVAVAGGVVAAAGAARRTLRRSVLAQWNRASTAQARRGWVLDAVIGVLAVAAIVELFASGTLGGAGHSPLALLAPGLIALTVALLSARVLPMIGRGLFNRTSAGGGLGTFLAARQLARRPGGARTTIALTTAFGLVTFTIAAYSVVGANLHDVAWTEVGAAQVLDVTPPAAVPLAAIVDKLDPSGQQAVAVDRETSTDLSNGEVRTLIATDPTRFAKVAYWRNDFAPASLSNYAAQLDPPEPAPISLLGDELSVTMNVHITSGAVAAEAYATVQGFETSGSTPVDLGPVTLDDSGTFTAQLPNCSPDPCRLRQIYLQGQADSNPATFSFQPTTLAGTMSVTGLSVHDNTGWHPINAGFGQSGHWVGANTANDAVNPVAGGVQDTFRADASSSEPTVGVSPVDAPALLPALVTGSMAAGSDGKPINTAGLDDDLSLTVSPVGVASALPGIGGDGLVVDQNYAELSGAGVAADVTDQVWLAPTAPADFAARLRAAGVSIQATQSATDTLDQYDRQGPALALVLFLADAIAAALLAAGGAVLGMHLAGRRRSYEMAALVATGATKRALGGGLLIEQGVTLGFGAILGIGAGLLATVLAVPSIPEFVNLPFNGGAPLRYTPSAAELTGLLGAAIVLLAAAAVLSAVTLIRGVRSDQLREAAP